MENIGKIVQVSGPVVDVEFSDNNLPSIKDALYVINNGKKCVMAAFLQVIPGSLHRVPSFTCWLLRIGVALVAGRNPTSHDTSLRQPCTTCLLCPEGKVPLRTGQIDVKTW